MMRKRDITGYGVLVLASFHAAGFAQPTSGIKVADPTTAGGGARQIRIKNFLHPGILHSRKDLEFIRQEVSQGEEPWKGGWEKLLSEKVSSLEWQPKPVANVFRGRYNNPDIGSSAMMYDSASAYSHALQWVITGKKAHAQKAIEILNAWSSTLRTIEGPDEKLLPGITAYKFCAAAEILRYSGAGWKEKHINEFKAMLLNVIYPLIKDFRPEANGNWDASMVNSMLSIGVFCDDKEKFIRAADYFLNGKGKGSIMHYVYDSGQCQESTRDQQHTQLGLGMLAAACETAWKQGVDLYGAANNRLALGFEYTAKYNLGYDVPAEGTISPLGRGRFRPIYEKVYQHYVYEKGLAMPYTKMVIDKIRPEGWQFDHEAWGTLLFYKGPQPR